MAFSNDHSDKVNIITVEKGELERDILKREKHMQ